MPLLGRRGLAGFLGAGELTRRAGRARQRAITAQALAAIERDGRFDTLDIELERRLAAAETAADLARIHTWREKADG